jgi:hypothetical protein
MKYVYECKICGNYHGAKNIYYHLLEKRRMKDEEVNRMGIEGFGKIYSFARYCPKTKGYTILSGFIY